MEKPEQGHVFVDDETGKRFCFYSFCDALTFNERGEIVPFRQGKTEIPFEEWTGEELCCMISGCLQEAKMGRLSNLRQEGRAKNIKNKTEIEKEKGRNQEARIKPFSTAELFQTICSILKDKNLMPNILDYGLPAHDPVPILTYEYDLRSNLGYGGNEGIYLNLWIECCEENEKKCNDLGTFKTLNTSREAMHAMAGLLADFIVEEYDFVNAHLDDFTWTGADVHAAKDGKKLDWGYTCGSMESAVKKKDELLQKYPSVIIRNNATRKETEFKNA